MSEESGSTYKTYSVPTSEMCPEMYPRKYSTRGFWLDGWLVDAPASEVVPTTTEDIAQRIISVSCSEYSILLCTLKFTVRNNNSVLLEIQLSLSYYRYLLYIKTIIAFSCENKNCLMVIVGGFRGSNLTNSVEIGSIQSEVCCPSKKAIDSRLLV